MSRKYFGTDGVRGRVGDFPITPKFAMKLGYAAGRVLMAEAVLPAGSRPTVLIGKDTRISGYLLEAALEAGFSAAGVDVCLVGPLPTPGVAYLTRALRLQAGIVISASHNPYEDNGIKFFSAAGTKLPDRVEQTIEAELEQPMGCVDSERLGRVRRIDDAKGRYIEFCKRAFPSHLHLRGMRLVVDCAHGAGYQVAPSVFHELGAEVHVIGAEPDGLNINAGCGATAPDALRQEVLAQQADLGIALDGDGDRLVMVGPDGQVYDGDHLLYAMVKSRLAAGQGVAGVAGTLMSNLALEHALERLGVPFVRTAVGDRYVVEALIERGWLLGGENSGHLLSLDKHTTGDGIIAALQVLSGIRQQGLGVAELLDSLTLYPQILINVPIVKGFVWKGNKVIESACELVENTLSGEGRVLLRASGTEPVLRVMVEGRNGELVREQAEYLAGVVQQVALQAS